MLKKTIKRIAFALAAVMLVMPSAKYSQANAAESSTVYVDGIAYNYNISDDGTVTVEAADKDVVGKIVLDAEGEATATVLDENNETTDYELEVNELSHEDVDVTVKDEDGDVVETFDEVEEIIGDEYEGQAAMTATVTVISIATLLEVILVVTATIVVAGVTYYAVSNVIAKIKADKQKQKLYYKAVLSGAGVYISFNNSITLQQATARVKAGQNIYTYLSSMARSAVLGTGLGSTASSEIDKNRKKGKVYYYHWHTANRNGAHAWFGIPYTA